MLALKTIHKYFKIIPILILLFSFYSHAKSHNETIYTKIELKKPSKDKKSTTTAASKGGKIILGEYGSFDSLNWFASKGLKPKGLNLIHETLMHKSAEEDLTYYPLIAEYIKKINNKLIVHINPKAKWHDSSPITADDIVFSFYELINKASPFFRSYYQDIEKVEKINNEEAQFIFKTGSNCSPFSIAELPVLQKAKYIETNIGKTTSMPPTGSGPYIIDSFEMGQYITYKHNKNYWGQHLYCNNNKFNFDYITFKYYHDHKIMEQAFQVNDFDVFTTITAKQCNKIQASQEKDKNIKCDIIKNNAPSNMVGLFINTRKTYLQNPLVREALNYAFDFKWFNKSFFDNQYKRIDSYFANSEHYTKTTTPTQEELLLLKKYEQELPKEIFTKQFIPPNTLESESIENNLNKALILLNQAGWKIKNGKLIDKNKTQMKIEILDCASNNEKFLQNFTNNLKKLGINAEYRIVDYSIYKNILYMLEYDIVRAHLYIPTILIKQAIPYWHSKFANIQGSKNLSGVQNKLVDLLVTEIINTDYNTVEDFKTNINILDRVLLWNYYVIPLWYSDNFYIAYWNKFNKPQADQTTNNNIFKWWVKEKN